jgi:hypothetical protein
MVTFDANHVFIGVVNLRSGKPKSKQAHLHSFAPLPTIHNKNGKINIKIHSNAKIHRNNAKIQNYQHTILLLPCDVSLK